jgi:hypothetical protein
MMFDLIISLPKHGRGSRMQTNGKRCACAVGEACMLITLALAHLFI